MKQVSVFLAEGFEEVEAVTPIDYLRRAGLSVTVTAISSRTLQSSRKLTVVCDNTIETASYEELPDLVVLPGGMPGSSNLAASVALRDLVTRMFSAGRLVAAICAAPAVALGQWGLLDGYRWTCFPGMEGGFGGRHTAERLVRDRNLITARGAGVAEEFSLKLVEELCGRESAAKIRSSIMAR